MKIRTLLVIAFLFCTIIGYAQNPPFWNDVQKFKKQDSTSFPAKKQILFIGSSSFTMWKDAEQYFPGYKILNRAFGGSQLSNQIHYVKDVVYPYNPKQIIIYCGENDFTSSPNVTADTVLHRFQTLFNLIRSKYKKTPIAFVSIKPSPSRWHLKDKMIEANSLIQQFLATKKRTDFIEVYSKMLNQQGLPQGNIFLKDSLHMNAQGYAIWQKAMAPYLKK